ncbi:MAG: hypothetical protein HY703_01950 [Gemmatimonadetes bacterium]|nr:hypothetical protein [Gemmatimonadota bacterium]
MHILLTDILSCPRCGPGFGLILLADRIEERRVLEGWLGCANCRERYGIGGGFADLRPPPAPPLLAAAGGPPAADPDEAFRMAALLGVAEGPGFLLVVGPAARLTPGISAIVANIEVVAADEAARGWSEQPGVSRLAVGAQLPFFSRTMRAVALTGDAAGAGLEEGARALAPLGRLVLEPAPPDAEQRLGAAGLRVAARQAFTVVAERP